MEKFFIRLFCIVLLILATYTIPAGGGEWVELGNLSASGGGISNTPGESSSPQIGIDSSGNPVVAWLDCSHGNEAIYVKRWDGTAWVELGNLSASGEGLISHNNGFPKSPSLIMDNYGNPVIAWQDFSSGNYEIYVKRWMGGKWVAMGKNSFSGGGISNTPGDSYNPCLATDNSGNIIAAWQDKSMGTYEVYVKRWNGKKWVELGKSSASGGGISSNVDDSENPSVGICNLRNIVVAWNDWSPQNYEIYVKEWNGKKWGNMGIGSSYGGGISDNLGGSQHSVVAMDKSGNPVIAWHDWTNGIKIYGKRWDGDKWADMGTNSAAGGGISSNPGASYCPTMVMDGDDRIVLAWHDYTPGNNNSEIYVRYWTGVRWFPLGENADSGGGISNNPGESQNARLARDKSGNIMIAWQDNTSGNFEIYVKRWRE